VAPPSVAGRRRPRLAVGGRHSAPARFQRRKAMKTKVFSLIAAFSVVSLLLAGCGTETPTNTPVAAAPTNTAAAMTAPTNTTGAATGGGQFAGVTVNILTFTGPQIAEPLQRRAPDFAALTGAKINVVTVPFSDLYQKILTDMATKTNSYQAFVFDPQWMGDFVTPGYLEELTARVKADNALQWQDIGAFFRNFSATYGGKIYTVPLDGDFQMVYYRSDLLKQTGLKPPQTWADYMKIA